MALPRTAITISISISEKYSEPSLKHAAATGQIKRQYFVSLRNINPLN
jgi:hypothetical protein